MKNRKSSETASFSDRINILHNLLLHAVHAINVGLAWILLSGTSSRRFEDEHILVCNLRALIQDQVRDGVQM